MRLLELYINNERIELFNDESIVITDSIQNIMDISKIFTPYSKTFNVPASRSNNKVFKHFYNSSILDGFDSRFTVESELKLNGATFKKGKIRLDGTLIKNNIVETYKITFFGNTIALKEALKDDELTALNYFDDYDHQIFDIVTGFTVGLGVAGASSTNREIIYSLISAQEDFIYDNVGSGGNDLNLYGVDQAGVQRNLKPAIKATEIINAIEYKYPDISFSTDFFGSDVFSELYLWCSQKAGFLNQSLTNGVKKLSDFTFSSGTDYLPLTTSSSVYFGISFTIPITIPAYQIVPMNVIVRDKITGEIVYKGISLTGASNNTGSFTLESDESKTWDLELKIWAEENFSTGTIIAKINRYTNGVSDGLSNYTSTDFLHGNAVSITNNMPKIGILELLTNWFKMFNLTAYLDNDGVIVVKTLDDFYSTGIEYDITAFIDASQSSINRAIPYSSINFMYSQPKDFYSLLFLENYENSLGTLKFKSIEKYEGASYDLSIRAYQPVLRKIYNINGGLSTTMSTATLRDSDLKPVSTDPIMFFNKQLTGLNILNSYTTANVPSYVTSDGNHTLHFSNESDIHTGVDNTNSLFSRFYSQYINRGFNERSRIEFYSAYLPNNILLKYQLNDVFIINDKKYIINTLKTNLLTGRSDIELITILEDWQASVLT
jgi:hypothetical protein